MFVQKESENNTVEHLYIILARTGRSRSRSRIIMNAWINVNIVISTFHSFIRSHVIFFIKVRSKVSSLALYEKQQDML